VPHLLVVGAELDQDPRRDSLAFAQDRQEEVLRADVVVPEVDGFAERELEHLLRARRERDLAHSGLVAAADDSSHLRVNVIVADAD
jgi:hypothetical protein